MFANFNTNLRVYDVCIFELGYIDCDLFHFSYINSIFWHFLRSTKCNHMAKIAQG
jgi:hypothetical protein